MFVGKLTWISARVDDRTRMARARAEFANSDGRLRAQMFARARIITSPAEKAMVIPPSAVQRIEGMPFAFVQVADDLFEARPVRLCTGHEGRVEVLEGLQPGDQVVTQGSFLVKSQLLISRLGAGCVHE
jgi:cobalt-zinc-cadmium efflux system membrane fusion protein